MPGYDRTGPWGRGPRTGAGLVFAAHLHRMRNRSPWLWKRSRARRPRTPTRLPSGLLFFQQRAERRRLRAARRNRWDYSAGPVGSDPQAEAADLRRRLEAVEMRLAGMEGFGVEPKQA